MIRVSTTTLESFRLWSDPEQTWMPESDLLDNIRGVFKPTAKMLLGLAFGRCLETPDKFRKHDSQGEYYAVPVQTAEGAWQEILFPGDTMRPCLAKFDRRGVFEVKNTKQYGDVTVVAKVDQILGVRIKENKSKLGQFDFDRYNHSCQWRFYLDVFDAAALDYLVFVLDEDTEGTILHKSTEEFSMFPYSGLRDDCQELVEKFVDYAKLRELIPFLTERQRAWA